MATARHGRVEIWFQDEARFGQKGSLARTWGMRGERLVVNRALDYEWTYLYGAVCPQKGTAHALLLPYADIEGMRLYLEHFANSLGDGVHALLVCDQAGWHTSSQLIIPDRVHLFYLPPKSPELNPTELVWREMRQKFLANRVFPNYDYVCDAVCEAWREVTKNPELLKSLCGFKYITDIFK